MFRITRLIGLFTVLFVFTSFAVAQSTISQEKRKLISELVSVLKLDRQMGENMDTMLKEMQKVHIAVSDAAVDARNDLTVAEKKAEKALYVDSFRPLSEKFLMRIAERFDYEKYVREIIYPIYDQFYTEQNLKDMVAFYRSPTGQRFVETQPQFTQATIAALQEKFLPQLIMIMDEILQEEALRRNSPPAKAPVK